MEIPECSHLDATDVALVSIYITACVNDWAKLPSLTRQFYAAGGAVEELRGCLRHLIVLAGYGPCLAAFLTLQKAKLLPEDSPAKIGGEPGDAFELVYTDVTDAVRRKCHSADPALGEWIRFHLYGDVYSSPGLDLRRKQLLMCARLAQANMGQQLFGHALAALRFGNTMQGLQEAIDLAFALSPLTGPAADAAHADALKILPLSLAKFEKSEGGVVSRPEITIPDPTTVRVPEVFLLGQDPAAQTSNASAAAVPRQAQQPAAAADEKVDKAGDNTRSPEALVEAAVEAPEGAGAAAADDDEDDGITFAWEEVDPRIDPKTGEWRE